MKLINIFRTGKHTDSKGISLDFDEDKLKAAVENYDPALHQAPVVVGHPKTDDPAFGWIKSLMFKEGNIYAVPEQVNPDFEQNVKNGAYKKVSASWYLPDSPNNPKPGALYLRHVGMLGGMAPAIKGLEAIQFNDTEAETIEFMDEFELSYTHSSIAGTFRRIREFIIDKFSKDDADGVIPSYLPDELEQSAKRILESEPEPEFNEGDNVKELEQLKNENAALKQQIADQETETGALKAKVASFEESQKQSRKKALAASVAALVTAGKVLPANQAQTLAFAELLDSTDGTIDFGEGDDKVQLNGADAFFKYLEGQGDKVDFGEHSKDDKDPEVDSLTPRQLAQKAQAHADETGVSFNEALNEIIKTAE